MRKATTLFTILAGLMFSVFALATPAAADPGGNNGDVKIHDTTTAVEDHRNEPHVCTFYIDGFNFDGGSSGSWRIEGWAPTGSGVVRTGTWGPADEKGNWHSVSMTLANGHYKLFFKQTRPVTPGGEKQKVFWVECANAKPTVGGTTTTNTGGTTTTNGDTTTIVGGMTTVTTSSGSNTTTGGTTIIVGGATSVTGGTTTNAGGTTTVSGGTAVQGFQSGPSGNAIGTVSPIVETPGGSDQQSPNLTGNAVNGAQSAPVTGIQSLPSTSTNGAPAVPLAAIGIALIALGGLLLRRHDHKL